MRSLFAGGTSGGQARKFLVHPRRQGDRTMREPASPPLSWGANLPHTSDRPPTGFSWRAIRPFQPCGGGIRVLRLLAAISPVVDVRVRPLLSACRLRFVMSRSACCPAIPVEGVLAWPRSGERPAFYSRASKCRHERDFDEASIQRKKLVSARLVRPALPAYIETRGLMQGA
jgi:hypothetical protein